MALTCSLVSHQLADLALHGGQRVPRGLLRQQPSPAQVGKGKEMLGAIALGDRPAGKHHEGTQRQKWIMFSQNPICATVGWTRGCLARSMVMSGHASSVPSLSGHDKSLAPKGIL